MKRVLALVLAVTATLAAPVAQAQSAHPATQSAVDRFLVHSGPGAAVYAGTAGDSWTVTAGTARINARQPITPDEHFRAASQTKTFTAVLVLQLVDRGLVDLDAPIGRYLPGVVTGNGYDENAVTARHLLQHTSGLPRSAVNPRPGPDGGYALAELVRAGLTQPPLGAPGGPAVYSNLGFYVLGLLVERLTGQDYPTAVRTRITEPLGLTRTSYPVARTMPGPFVPGYVGGRAGPLFFWLDITTVDDPRLVASAGALTSTLRDLAAFQRALADGRLVSAASLAEMRRTVPLGDGLGAGLGLLHMYLSCGGEAWGHAGDFGGTSSVTMVTDDGRFASVVTNAVALHGGTEPTRYTVADTALCEAAA